MPDSFGSCFGHCLEHTGHAVPALPKSLYFKGNRHPWQYAILPGHYSGHASYALHLLYLLNGQLLRLKPRLRHQLPDCQGASEHYELGRGSQQGLPQAHVFPHSLTSKGVIYDHSTVQTMLVPLE